MRFAEPLAFLALLLLPLAVFGQVWLDRRRRSRLKQAGDVELLDEMSSVEKSRMGGYRIGQRVLFSLAFVLVAGALARPQFGMRSDIRKGRGMDVVLALDLSRSMFAKDVVPSRLERARIELGALIDSLPGDRIGLVGFTSVAVPLCPLTVDHATVKLQLDASDPADMPRGGTSIADAIQEAEKMLESSKTGGGKAIVIITDGEEHEGDPEGAAREAEEEGIEVHVVGVGSRTGEPIPLGSGGGYLKDRSGQTVISRLNEDMLEKIAAAGGGLAALPGPSGGLDLGSVHAHLQRIKKAELESRVVRVYEERYRWALLPALLLLLLASAWRPPRRRTQGAGVALLVLLLSPAAMGAGPLESEDPDVKTGNTALREGKGEDANHAYEKAQTRLGEDPRLQLNRGLAEVSAGELDKALERFEAAAAGAKDRSLRSRAHYARGNTYRKLKKYDEAVNAYRRALLEDPKHSGARRNLEIAQAMRRIQKLNPNENENSDEKDDNNQNQDAGPNDAADAGAPDGGGDGGSPDAGGRDGSNDGGADSGSSAPDDGDGGSPDVGDSGAAPQPSEPEEEDELDKQDLEQLLDALQEQEKALKRKQRMKKVKPGSVEKDW